MNYIFNRLVDGQITQEEVQLERWVWGVIYKDNTELHQFDTEGFFHQFGEIHMEDVKLFVMYKPDDPNKRIDMVVSEDMQPFHFYRNVRPATEDHFTKVYAFGFKFKGTNMKNEYVDGALIDPTKPEGELLDFKAVYHFILPDDRVITSDKNNIDLTLFDLNK